MPFRREIFRRARNRLSMIWLLAAAWFGLIGNFSAAHAQESPNAASVEYFETKVRPILAANCQSCHGAKKQESGLRLDSKSGLLKGGDGGPVVVASMPDKSRILQAVRHVGDLQMPPEKKLPDEAIAILTAWVTAGAAWPQDSTAKGNSDTAASHWAFQPIRKPALPTVQNAGWVRTPIDRFVLAKLEAKGMTPSQAASPRELIRRLYYDLIGLPPSATEVAEFEQQCIGESGSVDGKTPGKSNPQVANAAIEKLVDRLLASPHYGERWGRHWLDVARYADTKGYVFEEERRYPYAYTYRDYVIRSLNEDLPYDRFIVEQLAADQLPIPKDDKRLAALGFLTVGRRFLKDNNEIIDDRIDVVSRGLMGLTVGCARCHDHKYDPIPAADYYSLYGVFASSTEPDNLPTIGQPTANQHFADFEAKTAELTSKVNTFLATRRKVATDSLKKNVDKYLMVGFDLNWKAGSNKALFEKAKVNKIESEALRWFINRFRPQLEAAKQSPEFSLWHRLSELKPAEFAARAPALVERHRSEFAKSEVALALCKAMAERKPTNQREAVAVYAALMASANGPFKAWLARPESPIVVPIEAADQLPIERKSKLQLEKLRKELTSLAVTHPGAPDKAMVMYDSPQPYQPYVFLRGNPGRRGPNVPRQFVNVVAGPTRKPFSKGSGRLELAQAIASPANPLTARVIANRIWAGHFGAGIVRTPSDFGLRGDPPTHAEMLDYLASRLIEHGWSLKKLHRDIVLSNAYLQRSDRRADCAAVDPDNLLVWRFNRRRLDWESLRDSLLASAGRLDLTVGGRGVSLTAQPFATRRAVYGWIDRQNLEGIFRTFDFAGPNAHSPQRFATTQPQQGLFLLNGPFVLEQTRFMARSACKGIDLSKSLAECRGANSKNQKATCLQITSTVADRLYRAILARTPNARELDASAEFLQQESELAQNGADAKALEGRLEDAAERLAQSLLLTNEFMFVD